MTVSRSLLASCLLLLCGPAAFAHQTPPGQTATGRWTCRPETGAVCPLLTQEVKPDYPLKALQGTIEGTVRLECLVTVKGRCSNVKVTGGLDPRSGLNDAAVAALKKWRFIPGTRNSQPIPVGITVELDFVLRLPADAAEGLVYKVRDEGMKLPVLIKEVKSAYPPAAMKARIEGSVWLVCIVEPAGVCSNIKVVRSLDDELGLDEAAIRALSQWRFLPGTKDGQPVRVLVTIEMNFTLK